MIDIKSEEIVALKEQGMSDAAITRYFSEHGKPVSITTIAKKLRAYYASQGKEKPNIKRKKQINIEIEEIVRLKEQGMSDEAIARYFSKQGKPVSQPTINNKLRAYYASQGKEKPNIKKEKQIKIEIEEIVRLKEQGMSDAAIAKYFSEQGKPVSQPTINNKLRAYYASQGKEKPNVKKEKQIKIEIEEIVRLKEQGMSDAAIVQYFREHGEQISLTTVAKRLSAYYASQGKEKPKIKKEKQIKIEIEELVRLKEQGMSDAAITKYFSEQGKQVSLTTVAKRLRAYYASQGKEKPKIKKEKQIKIEIEELVQLKEQGMSDAAIVQYFSEHGKQVSLTTVARKLSAYYASQGKEKTKAKMGAKKIEIEKEELVRLKEKGMTYVAIAQYLSEHGKSVSQATIFNRIRDYYNQASKEGRESNEQSSLKEKHETDKPVSWEKLYSKLEDNMIMEILMHGMTIEEYSKRLNRPEHKENLQKRFKKFRFVVEHDEKIKDKWLADQNLLEVVDRVESLTDHPKERYIRMIERIIGGNKCQHGNIDLIKYHVFKDNQDLMAYILSDSELSYGDYDLAVWNHTKKSYEEKIKRIFSRMHKIEMGIEKREKNSKKPIKEGQER